MDILQRLPEVNEVIEIEGWRLTVVEIRSHRIESLWLSRQDPGSAGVNE